MGETNEVVIARIDERLRNLADIVVQMAEDHRTLAASHQKMVENNERTAVLESEVAAQKESLETLWKKHDAHVDSHNKFIGHAGFEVAKLVVAVLLGAALNKYGITLPT